MSSTPDLDAVSLYIHFPWCVKKCPYCDFNSHALKATLEEDRYIAVLTREYDDTLEHIAGRPIQSIFLGGGTPSLFHGKSLAKLLSHIERSGSTTSEIEITLEANPGTLEYDRFTSYLDAGINRLSLGIQSFNDKSLRALGRIHDAGSAHNAIEHAHKAGFSNFNIDLMFGIPGQNIDGVLEDARCAVAAAPKHISYYQLTIEPNTLFHRYPPTLPKEDLQHTMQDEIIVMLSEHGFERYEISAYSHEGYQSRHNLNYWNFGDYLGIGAGAHSKLFSDGITTRSWNEKQPARYQSLVENGESYRNPTVVDNDDLLFEFMLNGLRLKGGFSLAQFETRTGLPRDVIFESLSGPIAQELVIVEQDKLKCSEKGYLFVDEILQQLLP